MSVRRIMSAVALVLALTALAGGCGGGNGGGTEEVEVEGTEQGPANGEEGAAEVHVVLTRGKAEWSPTSIGSGRVTFLVENETAEERAFSLVFCDMQFNCQEGLFFEGHPLPGGASEEFSVYLEPGQYSVCNQPMQGPNLCTFNLIAE